MSVILREKKQKSKSISFYLEINQNNNRKREYLNIVISKNDNPIAKKEKRETAKAIRSQREIELIASGSVYVPQHKRKIDFIEYYRNYINNYTKADVRMIRYSYQKFSSFLMFKKIIKKENDIVLPAQITKNICEDFRDYLKGNAGLNGETPQNYFSRFKKVIKQATKDGLFKSNPVEDLIFEKGSQDKRNRLVKEVLSISEIKLLKETHCGNDEVKRAFLFSCLTGLGLAEIKALRWGNIKLVDSTSRLITDREKTGRQVNIKLSDSAVEVLGKSGKADEKIFKIEVSDNAVNKALEYWVKRAGIDKNITYYCARHSYAVNLLKLSNNIKVVADAMGQTSTQHTTKYLNFIDAQKDEATGGLLI